VDAVAEDDPFGAAPIHDADKERTELEEVLANAQSLVAQLEIALERARENERVIAARLAR
jgi:GAF domain-containing protein